MRLNQLHSLTELVPMLAARFGDIPAVASSPSAGGRGLTYAQWFVCVKNGAHHLRSLGLAPGDRVLLVLEGRPEWVAAFFSILEAGLVPVPMAVNTPAVAMAALANYAGISAAIVGSLTPALTARMDGTKTIPVENLFQPARQRPQAVTVSRPELAMLALTSGSTQHPRVVELTHANLLANLDALLQVRQAQPGDAFLSMLPPAHLFEFVGGLVGPLCCGACVVYASSLLPNRLLDSLRAERITHALCVPALLDALYFEALEQLVAAGSVPELRRGQSLEDTASRLQKELRPAERQSLQSEVRSLVGPHLRTLVVGGAALNPAWAAIAAALGLRMEVGYGLTEASPIVSVGWAGECPHASVGRPLPGVQVRVDSHGEILIRGPNVMRGYWQDPAGTAAALAEGWLKTGDQGRLDADGFLYITGRSKEAMVTAAGETIYPDEVEPYYASPLFAECCVTGMAGPAGNDMPTLFVVPAAANVNESSLKETFLHLRAAAPARYRVHQIIPLRAPLPRTPAGKIQRRALALEWQHRMSCP